MSDVNGKIIWDKAFVFLGEWNGMFTENLQAGKAFVRILPTNSTCGFGGFLRLRYSGNSQA